MSSIPGWHKEAPVRRGVEHLLHVTYPDEGGWRSEPYVRDTPLSGERPVLLSDGERVHIHDAIQEYLVANDIPEEAQGWWASITLKLLEGVEDGEASGEVEDPLDDSRDDVCRD